MVTKYLLDPRWSTSANSPAFPIAITERLIGTHLKFVARPRPDCTFRSTHIVAVLL